ncbi:cilia- and flagella-associated protein 45 isoform X2 [Kryptolebias marmoratus]|uniref:cilia- and flagella-associated protein 45 isoform X2 n=1 Tax=Kryptolebias marmoratus TaxID=37003 RepID=UPI0007F8D703|nr:cilia- and flagella-associated protein 45 isoform X2 [Kryptolebias marmoratus]
MNPGSSSTFSGSRTYPGRYRMLAPRSQVDETLFGSPKDTAPSVDLAQRNKGEIIQIITKDFIRNLRIPQKDPLRNSVFLPPASFARITSTSRSLSKEDREASKQAYWKKKEEKMKAAEARKREIQEADLSRVQNQALTDLELEAHSRSQRLVERANTLRMEQEDEIKTLNQLILGAQCQATRDAQIQEKNQIQVELAEEEKRLDTMMEVERRRAVERTEKIDEQQKEQRIQGKQQIYDQIQERLENKLFLDEIKDQEKHKIKEALERQNLEDLKALEEKKMKQQLLQEEIMRINAETMRAKEKKLEEEKLADMRDAEYQRKILERQAEYEAEQAKIKKEKELEIARLRAQQERAKDYKAEQDELRARRNQAVAERNWRVKEKELAVKKAREEAALRAARLEQVHNKERCLAMEANREKAMLERVLKVQKEVIAKEKEQEERQLQKALRHAETIRQQVKEQELSAVARRREFFREADRLMEEERQRRVRLREIKEKKLMELKATGISEKYCTEVERKAQKTLSTHKH